MRCEHYGFTLQKNFMNITKDTHTHPFNGPLSRTTRVSPYQKGKTNLDFTEARDSEWQWHQLGHIQVCISLQTDNLARTPPLSFLQARCPSCHQTNSVKALKAMNITKQLPIISTFNILHSTCIIQYEQHAMELPSINASSLVRFVPSVL